MINPKKSFDIYDYIEIFYRRIWYIFIPLIIILPRVFGLGLLGIWIAYPVADILSVILTALFLRSELKKMSLSMW